ncbi:PH domain-containing protein [Streptomyces subrutilus]|uniref:PH domain-containing protein n=1 Tax=Streptomyces subrutilus TaxID=36818 RepID=UPI0033EECE99
MSARALPRDYRIRSGRTTVLVLAVGGGWLAALLPLWNDETIVGWVKLLVAGLLVVLFGWLLFAARRCSTSADLKGITVRGMTRTRRLAWEDVQDIRAVPNPSATMARNAPKVLSYAYDTDGKRLLLAYVDDVHVTVEREIDLLRAAWTELRGEDWEADADAARRIRRQHAREAGTARATAWITGAIVLFTVLFAVFLLASG